MTLQELFNEALSRAGIKRNDPRAFDISCLMEEICGVNKFELPIVGNKIIQDIQINSFFDLLTHWINGEPLQYLIGKWEFYGLPYFVGKGVLIPRQDTETLAEQALLFLKKCENPIVADLCSGSGCLAGTIAHYTNAKVFALELSDDALVYLRKNMNALKLSVEIISCNVCNPPPLPPLDLIVCNPPYIPKNEMEALDTNVKYEPEMALYGGEDGYKFYRILPYVYLPLLKPGGALFFETGYNQAQNVAKLMQQAGYENVSIIKDTTGIERVVCGYRIMSDFSQDPIVLRDNSALEFQ